MLKDVLKSAWHSNPASPVLVEELTHQCVVQGDLDRAEPVVEATLDLESDSERLEVVVPWVEALVADGQRDHAHRFLEQTAERLSPREAIGAANVARRLRDASMATKLFDVAGPEILEDPRALLESAQNKIWLGKPTGVGASPKTTNFFRMRGYSWSVYCEWMHHAAGMLGRGRNSGGLGSGLVNRLQR